MDRERQPERESTSGPPSASPQCGGQCPNGGSKAPLKHHSRKRTRSHAPKPSVPIPEDLDESRLVQVGFKGHRIDLCILPKDLEAGLGQVVFVEADRGVDVGRILRCDRGALKPNPKRPLRRITRLANDEEIDRIISLRKEEISALRTCRKRVEISGLPMQTVDAEFQFDGNRVTFYFTAEGRVDFRALVRDLAKIFRTRIELRQIPPREAARRQGGAGPCGRDLCCSSFLQAFEPVTLKMAKRQNLALAPQRISGICGRLLCCLGFDEGRDTDEGDGDES